jgi:histidinol-phosphate aminotransferase
MTKRYAWLTARLAQSQKVRYTSGVANLVAKYHGGDARLVRLNANENHFIPLSVLSPLLREVTDNVDPRLYPRSEQTTLVQRIGEYIDQPAANIVVGNSSDELIETIVRLLLRSGEVVLTITPTFVMYRIIVANQGGQCVQVPLRDDFSLDPAALLAKAHIGATLVFICSPNNPTGNQFAEDRIRTMLDSFEGIVVVDEAYVEYAPYSLTDAVTRHENLVVLRTFSKAFGLAGLRIGYALAHPRVADALRSLQLPFNVNKVSLAMASKVLEHRPLFETAATAVQTERARLLHQLRRVDGVEAFDSRANFILFKPRGNARGVFEGLLRRGVLVRDVGPVLDHGRCLRVTVGTPDMNAQFLDALRATMEDDMP